MTEDTKAFFKQCAKPFTHSWNSILSALRQLRDYWKEFKEWHHDPVGVSTRVPARHTPSEDGSVEVKMHSDSSSEHGSSLGYQYDSFSPHQVPLSAFAKLPPHMTLSPIGSYRPKSNSTPYSRSQSSMINAGHHVSSWSSETKIAPNKATSYTGDAHKGPRPLRPFPRSAYSSTELPLSQDPSHPLISRRHETEPILPAQAAWAPTVLKPEQY